MPNFKDKAKRLQRPPANATFLDVSDFDPTGGTTLEKVTALISVYTHIDPILPAYPVGALVKSLDLLGADINSSFGLTGKQRFFQSEIKVAWTVLYLASVVDLKVKKTP